MGTFNENDRKRGPDGRWVAGYAQGVPSGMAIPPEVAFKRNAEKDDYEYNMGATYRYPPRARSAAQNELFWRTVHIPDEEVDHFREAFTETFLLSGEWREMKEMYKPIWERYVAPLALAENDGDPRSGGYRRAYEDWEERLMGMKQGIGEYTPHLKANEARELLRIGRMVQSAQESDGTSFAEEGILDKTRALAQDGITVDRPATVGEYWDGYVLNEVMWRMDNQPFTGDAQPRRKVFNGVPFDRDHPEVLERAVAANPEGFYERNNPWTF